MESSLYVENRIKEQLIEASDLLQISACMLSKILIKKVCNLDLRDIRKNILSKYQESGDDFLYDTFRYRLSDEEYILFNSCRMKFRCSISLLLLIGYLLFFDKLIKKHFKKRNKSKILDSYTTNKSLLYKTVINLLKSFDLHAIKLE